MGFLCGGQELQNTLCAKKKSISEILDLNSELGERKRERESVCVCVCVCVCEREGVLAR